MPERKQNQLIHLAFSLITIGCTVGAVVLGYASTQAAQERMIAELRAEMTGWTQRVTKLEGIADAGQRDRLDIERRLVGIEVGQATILGVLKDMRDAQRTQRP